ncbi:DUF4013 domain-containing protein [Methanobrevibacter sp.]|uniref:DUF4013 domain-containing protein n=1 Tax=Methanobrevibacter sp. TaxID=66852 RepID=UPI00386F2F08
MKITEIIKDAFLFPSKNTGRYAIYLLLSVLIVLFALGGVLTNAFGIIDSENYLTGGMYFLIAFIIGILISGYHIKIIKSGIEHDENVPGFKLYEDFMTGFDNAVVLIFYYMIPALIVVVVGYGANLFGNAIAVCQEVVLQAFNVYIMSGPVDVAVNAISHTLSNFANSLAITVTVALVLYVVFSFLQSMAGARLANTGSLKEALNIFESAKDMKKIGVGKVIIVTLVVLALIAVIELLLAIILNKYPFLLLTFSIVITPYFVLVTQRALGLLYSDIV